MATINVKDASGAVIAIEKPLVPGRTVAADSRPVALSTEDKAAIDALRYAAAAIVSLQTSATGATFVAWGAAACRALDVVNTHPDAVDLELRRGGAGATIIVPAGSSRLFVGLADAADLQLRRFDQADTQVTVTAEALS